MGLLKKNIVITLVVILPLIVSCDKQFMSKIEDKKQVTSEIVVKDIDGKNYELTYKNESYKVIYTYDFWKIYDSYKISNVNDMKKICQALIDINPIPGKDMISYRTADDMVYEWIQHNIAYRILPDDNRWKENAKDVDFDPYDQGKSVYELYEDRTEEKFDISSMLK